jgi:AraC family transcriptional regulator
MNESIHAAMSRVIRTMYERVGDDITVDDMARTAMYSKFHFSRMFREATGVPPARFLSALRFQEAKRLLAATSLSVAEISNRVGFSSLGTFSTRFKKFVGVTPTEYRQGGRWWPSELPTDGQPAVRDGAVATIRGSVRTTGGGDCGPTFVGLFSHAVPHSLPVRSTVLEQPGYYVLEGVPGGTWYLLVQGVGTAGRDAEACGVATTGPGLVGRLGPIRIDTGDDAVPNPVDVTLRPMRVIDLPVLSAPFATHPGELCRPAAGAPPKQGLRRPGADLRLRSVSAT